MFKVVRFDEIPRLKFIGGLFWHLQKQMDLLSIVFLVNTWIENTIKTIN